MGIFISTNADANGHTSNTSCYGSARHVQRIATGLNQLELKHLETLVVTYTIFVDYHTTFDNPQ